MNAESSLLVSHHPDGVVVITFNRPKMLNALDLATMSAFRATIEGLVRQESLRVLILTGAGKRAFCSGGDLAELSQHPSEDDASRMISLMGDALLSLEQLPVPVIAAMHGYALGGGSEIALACDMRIADPAVRMGLVQIRMGLTPGWGAGQRLLRAVGYARAMEILLRGHTLNAQQLLAYGLLNDVDDAPLEQALIWAHRIAREDQAVVRSIKALLQAGLRQPYDQALQTERDLFPPLWAAEAHLRAVEAFLNRPDRASDASAE